MATAKKLPSGAWRTRATKIVNGKKVTKSFTVHPSEVNGESLKVKSHKAKNRSELLAREWQDNIEVTENYGTTIGEAINEYIKGREKVLSPRSIHDYKALIPFFDSIKDIYTSDINTAQIQTLINEWSLSLSRKTIQNRIGFLMSVLSYADCDKKFKLRYPQKAPTKKAVPDIQDLRRLLSEADDSFQPIILLAAFGSLRRGEICALKQKDISRDMTTV